MKTEIRKVLIPLSEAERREKTVASFEASNRIDNMENEKREYLRTFRKNKTHLQKVIRQSLGDLDRNSTLKEVECAVLKNFDLKVVEYVYNGRLVDSRIMTEDDTQVEMPLEVTA